MQYLPDSVDKVFFRSDTAAYQWDLLLYMAKGLNPRFGVINFSVSCDVTPEFKRAVAAVPEIEWKKLARPTNNETDTCVNETGHEYAEVCFVPKALSSSNQHPALRFVAIRELLLEKVSPEKRVEQLEFPFPTIKVMTGRYSCTAL